MNNPDDQSLIVPEVASGPTEVGTLWHTNNPAEIVDRATEVANTLARVLEQKRLYADIQGKRHVSVEGWTLLGTLLGVVPVVEWTRPLPDGMGWEARVIAQTVNGRTVGAAEASCTRDERRWKSAEDYSLRSMAQTRATSRALRGPLGFIVALAGYEATASEEMPPEPQPAPRQERKPAPAKQPPKQQEPPKEESGATKQKIMAELARFPESERNGILEEASYFRDNEGRERCFATLDELLRAKDTPRWFGYIIGKLRDMATEREAAEAAKGE